MDLVLQPKSGRSCIQRRISICLSWKNPASGDWVKNGKEFLEQQNYTVHIADQGKIMDLERVKDQVARSCLHGLSVVIDDGSHISTDMITSFHSLYPLLQPGGIYFLEDIGHSCQKDFRDKPYGPLGCLRPGICISAVSSKPVFYITYLEQEIISYH